MKSFLFAILTPEEQKLIVKTPMPAFMPVMLATLTEKRFSKPDWIYERKLDGERCLALKKGNEVTLKTRNNNVINASYPEIVEAFQAFESSSIIVDGELVAFEKEVTSFKKLQQRFGIKDADAARRMKFIVDLYIFDVLYVDGYDVTQLPLMTRKKILKMSMPFRKPLHYVSHYKTEGERYYKLACEKGWEGLIAKYKQSRYIQKRSSQWLKFKCVNRQELVIGGYTDPGGSRFGFGALLVGFYKNKKLHYAGRVGTGFDEQTLYDLTKLFKKLATDKNPFMTDEMVKSNVHFIKPILVGEFGFAEWTVTNKLRHSSFLGLRRDKNAEDVVQEVV